MRISQWALLGFVVWTLLLVVIGIGATRISQVMRGQARPNSFNPSVPHGSERYQRTLRAHANCVENLPIFAALVLLGSLTAVPDPLFQAAALAVLPARILQSAVHVASNRNRAVLARFVFFSVQLICFGIMVASLIRTAR
jgi:uncharacterized MAPEG superfamily protein